MTFAWVMVMVSDAFCFSRRRRHTGCALVTGVQTCALPISTTLLIALDSAETERLRAERAAGGKALLPYEAQGMTREEILNYFHDTVVFTRTEHGWKTPFNAEAMRGVKLISDLVDAETGKVVAEAGTKMTPRTSKKLIRSEEHTSELQSLMRI